MPYRSPSLLTALMIALGACSGSPTYSGTEDAGPVDEDLPADTVDQHRGREILSGVEPDGPQHAEPPNWVFLGGSHEIASQRIFPERSLWVVDLESHVTSLLLSDLGAIQRVRYAETANRVYTGYFSGLGKVVSVAPDGSDLVTHATETEGVFLVSPDGRFILHQPFTDQVEWVLIDEVAHIVRSVPDRRFLALGDGFGLYALDEELSELAVWDLETGDTTVVSGLRDVVSPGGHLPKVIGVGGSRDMPRVTVLSRVGGAARVISWAGDIEIGSGSTTEWVAATPDHIHEFGVSGDEINAAATPDGRRAAVSITTEMLHLCFGEAMGCQRFHWEIVVADVVDGSGDIVASGASYWPADGLVLSPDGRRLLYEVDQTLYLVELGGG